MPITSIPAGAGQTPSVSTTDDDASVQDQQATQSAGGGSADPGQGDAFDSGGKSGSTKSLMNLTQPAQADPSDIIASFLGNLSDDQLDNLMNAKVDLKSPNAQNAQIDIGGGLQIPAPLAAQLQQIILVGLEQEQAANAAVSPAQTLKTPATPQATVSPVKTQATPAIPPGKTNPSGGGGQI